MKPKGWKLFDFGRNMDTKPLIVVPFMGLCDAPEVYLKEVKPSHPIDPVPIGSEIDALGPVIIAAGRKTMKDKKQTMAYGLNMAAVVAGYNEALNWAGERRVTVEELAKTPITDLLDTMARNGIRFTFRAGEIEPEDLPFPLKNGQGDKTTTG